MMGDQQLVPEYRDTSDRMQVLRVQPVRVFGQVAYVRLSPLGRQRVVRSDAQASVAILDVENNRVAARLLPLANNVNALIASRHQAGEVHGLYFEILGDKDRILAVNRII